MSELVRFGLADDASVLVEIDDTDFGLHRVGRVQDGIVETGRRLNDALAGVREAAQESIRMLRSLSPDECELEFGVKFAGEAGAVIAKTSTEGHFVVKLSWARRNLAPDGE
jgi:Trypsin-co-occurring domain 1